MVSLTSWLLCAGLTVGCYKIWTEDVLITENLDEVWSIRGGDVEREVKTWNRYHNDVWEYTLHWTMLLGKGALQGADIMTPQSFAEVEPLYARFFDIRVQTQSGYEFSTLDLCARGSMPDYPGAPEFPCLVISPFHCFSEEAAHLPESYKPLDPFADQFLPPEYFGKPYATRPAYGNMSHSEMKAEASKLRMTGMRGCEWWTQLTTFAPQIWGGDVEWNDDETQITKVPSIKWTFYYDAPPRIKFRMMLTKPEQANEAEIEEALRLHEKAWQSEVETFAASLTDIEILNVGPSLEDDLIEDHNTPRWGLMALGGAMMWLFVAVSLASFRQPLRSRVNLGHTGLGVVGSALPASLGLWLFLGFKLNGPMIAALPFLALGLGVDDMFVLIRYFSELGEDFITSKDYPEILGEVLARGGAGATLTSICNTVAFTCGALLPVQALSEFCIATAIISVMNYFVIMTQFLGVMALEIHRVKKQRAEPSLITYFCHRRVLQQTTAEGTRASSGFSLEERATDAIKNWYGPFLTRMVVKVPVALLACALAALSVASIAVNKDIGFTVWELAPSGSHAQRALQVAFENYQTFHANICFYDLDVPEKQREMLELYDAVTTSHHAMPFDLPPYLTYFSYYVLGKGPQPVPNVANTTYSDMGWTLDSSWTHPLYAPFGTVTANNTKFYEMWEQWTTMPLDDPIQAYYPGGSDFITADLVGTNEYALESGPGSSLKFSFFRFYQTRLTDQETYLDAIKEVRDRFEASPLNKKNAFPWGPTFTYWSIFIELDPILVRTFLIDMGAIFLCTLLLLRSGTAALASTLACTMIVIMVYGGTVIFAKFNFFVATGLLASAGISVEFTSHLIASFTNTDGPLPERLGTAMAQTSPALIQGAVSTFLSMLPLAFNPISFVVKYFFGMFAILVAVGLLTGLLLLPGLLALFAPVSSLFQRGVASAVPGEKAGGPLPSILQQAPNHATKAHASDFHASI
jgi:hypothetical protein